MEVVKCLLLISSMLLMGACRNESAQERMGKELLIHDIPTACRFGGEPNLFLSKNEDVYLSWIEYIEGSRVELRFTKLQGDTWSEPLTVASGDNWFVNWADFPSLVAYDDNEQMLAAHWLQKSAEGTYDYDIHIAQSLDKGMTWAPSFLLHQDGIAAEHGFVTLLPISDERIFATWLDGRNTKNIETEEDSDRPGFGDSFDMHDHTSGGHSHGSGPMSLRSAVFDKSGALYEEMELDDRVCDCCQTSAALTEEGLVVVYRDRSEEEIRDISIVRQVDGKWLAAQPIFNDGWKVSGCPVNGPVVKARNNLVAVAWFSMAKERPIVRVAFSKNGGKSFNDPLRVDLGNPLGRVDLCFISDSEIVVCWMEQDGENADIMMAKVNNDGKVWYSVNFTKSSASRQSGFPQMVVADDRVILAWTDTDSIRRVRTAWLDISVQPNR